MSLKRIGKIINTFGIKGGLKVISTSNKTEERYKVKNKVIIDDNVYTISSFSETNSSVYILHLKEFDDINKCEFLVGKEIYQDIVLKDDEFFLSDIIGMQVKNLKNELLGEISDYNEYNNLFYFVVNKKLIPYIKDEFVDRIDFEQRVVYITELGEGTLI